MANINAPFGLSPQRTLAGSKFNEGGTRYYIPSTDNLAYYIGDTVLAAAAADATGVPGVIKASLGTETLRGVINGVEPANVGTVSLQGVALSLENINIPATKTRDYYVYVADDPLLLFKVQGDLTATNQVAANANNNTSLTVTAGANAQSDSGTVVNSSTMATTSSLSIKLIGLTQQPNNAFGAYAVWNCKINQHDFIGPKAGV